MQHLTSGDYAIMPWKNGGGTTTEIAIHPRDTGVRGVFLWRLSIADVASDGPFSRFSGYDRHIMLIEGSGMTLDAGGDGRIVLDRKFQPQRFSGDWTVKGSLRDGPVRDFNLMVWRSFANSRLTVLEIKGRHEFGESGATTLIHVLQGELLARSHVVAISDTLVFEAGERAGIEPLGAPALIAVAEIIPLKAA